MGRWFFQSAMTNRCLSVNCVIHLRKSFMGLVIGFRYIFFLAMLEKFIVVNRTAPEHGFVNLYIGLDFLLGALH
jgi:hypothetical protein